MSHSYYRWEKCHGGRNFMVGQMSGGTYVGGTNVGRTNVSGTKVAPPYFSIQLNLILLFLPNLT
jgi:hypothetical protein